MIAVAAGVAAKNGTFFSGHYIEHEKNVPLNGAS